MPVAPLAPTGQTGTLAAADEATVARTEEGVAAFHPALVRAWRVAQATLASGAIARTGRPLHLLTAAEQERLVLHWENDAAFRTPLALVSIVYKLVHFDQESVYRAIGGKLNVLSTLESPRWLRQIHRASEWTEGDLESDVVVIGTGAGGGGVGRELADRGLAVVFVEEGEHHRRDAFDGSSVRAHQRFYRGAFFGG